MASLKKNVDTNFHNVPQSQLAGQNFDQVLSNLGLIPEGFVVGPDGPTFSNMNYKAYGVQVNYGPSGGSFVSTGLPNSSFYTVSTATQNGLLSARQCVKIVLGMNAMFDNVAILSNIEKI